MNKDARQAPQKREQSPEGSGPDVLLNPHRGFRPRPVIRSLARRVIRENDDPHNLRAVSGTGPESSSSARRRKVRGRDGAL